MQNNTWHINSEFLPAILVTLKLLRGPLMIGAFHQNIGGPSPPIPRIDAHGCICLTCVETCHIIRVMHIAPANTSICITRVTSEYHLTNILPYTKSGSRHASHNLCTRRKD